MNAEFLHNAGMIPLRNIYDAGFAADAQGLPLIAVKNRDKLTLYAGTETMTLPVLQINQFPSEKDSLIKTAGTAGGLVVVEECLCEQLEQMSADYPGMKWILLGRFTAQQLVDYMKSPFVCAVCDASFADAAPDEWKSRCADARTMALGYNFAHMGINSRDEEECHNTVGRFQETFGFPAFDIGSSVIVAGPFEIVKSSLYGCCGHIGIETASVARAMADLQSKGFRLDESTIQYQSDGRPQSVYLEDEFGGFAVHLLQKR